MNRRTHSLILIAVTVALLLIGCSEQDEDEAFIYVDGTRGCKQAPGPVTLWDEAGAAAVGSEAIGEMPHGIRRNILDETSRFGITFYLVEYEGQTGWIPVNFTERVEPVCQ
jgi:hypothetical protein